MSKLLPGDAQTYSKAPSRYAEGAPATIGWAQGAWVAQSPVSPKLVDLTSGMGAVILGHQFPDVDAAVRRQLESAVALPLPGPREQEVAEYLTQEMLTWEGAESVRFGKNGADVTGSAVRLARAVTGRQRIAYMDYHGHHDWSMYEPPMNAGVPGFFGSLGTTHDPDLMDVPVHGLSRHLRRCCPGKLREILTVSKYAALVCEAVSSAEAQAMPPGFWEDVRQICDDTGTLFVLDEMVTGFRMAPGGAAEQLGIRPDIACYGKGMANGLPLSAIVGPWDILKRYEEDVFFSTTHGGEALSLAACLATMQVIRDEDVCEHIGRLGDGISEQAGDMAVSGYPQRLLFPNLTTEEKGLMLDQGVLCAGYANLTYAMCEDTEAVKRIWKAVVAVVESRAQ